MARLCNYGQTSLNIKQHLKKRKRISQKRGKAILTKLRRLKDSLLLRKPLTNWSTILSLRQVLILFYRIGNGAIDNSQLKAFVAQRNNRFMNFFKRGLKKTPPTEIINKEVTAV